MTYWEGHQDSYYRGVYIQPARGPGRARRTPELVDCALRLFVAANAWTHRHARPTPSPPSPPSSPGAADALAAVGITP